MDKGYFQEFIEDVHSYLLKQEQHETYENDVTDKTSQKYLLNQCRIILDLITNNTIEISINESVYLEMNTISEKEKMPQNDDNNPVVNPRNSTDTNEYMMCDITAAIYDNCSNLQGDYVGSALQNDDQNGACPYTGLPAAHLKIKNAIKIGYMYRIEKRLFFEQNKKYYTGILGRWMLFYANGRSDLKPTFCLCINNMKSIENLYINKKKNVFLFQFIYNDVKKYVFHTVTNEEMIDWVNKLNDIKNGVPQQPISPRKLPTIPQEQQHKDDCDEQKNENCDEIKNDEVILESKTCDDSLYEEPCNLFDSKNVIIENNKMICYVNGKKIEYDIPKNIPINENNKIIDNDSIEEEQCHNDNYEPMSIEVSKAKEKISNELVLLNPNDMKVSNKNKKIMNPISVTTTSQSSTTSTVKSWFRNRLASNKSTTNPVEQQQLKTASQVTSLKTTTTTTTTGHSLLVNEKTPPKGPKINMIINQLEANGHMPLMMSKNYNDRRQTKLFDDDLICQDIISI